MPQVGGSFLMQWLSDASVVCLVVEQIISDHRIFVANERRTEGSSTRPSVAAITTRNEQHRLCSFFFAEVARYGVSTLFSR